jgi:hypothetical protein
MVKERAFPDALIFRATRALLCKRFSKGSSSSQKGDGCSEKPGRPIYQPLRLTYGGTRGHLSRVTVAGCGEVCNIAS